MRTYLKTLTRMFKKHITRLLSLILIVLVSVGFVAGVGMSADKIKYSVNEYYQNANVSDFIIKHKGDGFSSEEIALLKKEFGSANVETGTSIDAYLKVGEEEWLFRLYFLPAERTMNRWTLLEGAEDAEVFIERPDNKIKELAVGTELSIDFKDILEQLALQGGKELEEANKEALKRLTPISITVGGIVGSPLAFGEDCEPSYLNSEEVLENLPDTTDAINALIPLDGILYLPETLIPKTRETVPEAFWGFMSEEMLNKPLLGTGDVFIRTENRNLFQTFSENYERYAIETAAKIQSLVENVRVLTLKDNYSFHAVSSYADKVYAIGYILMVAFLFVTALVALSTMTRLMEEERAQIACLRTLGYSAFKIVFKYLLFAMIATGIGGVASYFVGLGVARLIYVVFNYSFAMPPISTHVAVFFYLIIYFFIVVVTLAATLISGIKLTGETPAALLRPKAPKAGKKVFLERIPVLWKLLSFKYKSTLRNVLRYIYRFLMTVVAVAVSTALVLVGLALLDLCLFGGVGSTTITLVAIVVVVFAGLLTAVVIYTLTNINISERNRELATLMVLGYHDGEVAGYIYREVYIDTLVGIIFGMPLSLLLMLFLFDVMGSGSIFTVSWFMWFIGPIVILLFTAAVNLILRRKIVKIDMNESLKAIE